MPDFEWLDLPEGHLYASRWEQECNSIQAMEGELDASHVSFLHRRIDQIDTNNQALTGSYFQEDRSPRWHVRDTDYGFIAASQRVRGYSRGALAGGRIRVVRSLKKPGQQIAHPPW